MTGTVAVHHTEGLQAFVEDSQALTCGCHLNARHVLLCMVEKL